MITIITEPVTLTVTSEPHNTIAVTSAILTQDIRDISIQANTTLQPGDPVSFSGTKSPPIMGIALISATSGQPVTVRSYGPAPFANATAPGTKFFYNEDTQSISTTPSNTIYPVGRSINGSTILVNLAPPIRRS